jgi:hypothetical protein
MVTGAGATVSKIVGMTSVEVGLVVQNAKQKLQWYGLLLSVFLSPRHLFLPTTLASLTGQTCHRSPRLSCTSSMSNVSLLCDGLTGYAIRLYNTLAVKGPHWISGAGTRTGLV